MGFFDRYLSAPEPRSALRRRRPSWGAPEDVLPAIVPIELLLARTPQVAVWLPTLHVYPSGFGVRLSVHVRGDDDPGHFAYGLHGLFGPAGDVGEDDALRLAVVGANGTDLSLFAEGGGGGSNRYHVTYWVQPLPPPGSLAFVVQWRARGVPESRAEVAGQAVLDAATRAVRLWPEEVSS